MTIPVKMPQSMTMQVPQKVPVQMQFVQMLPLVNAVNFQGNGGGEKEV